MNDFRDPEHERAEWSQVLLEEIMTVSGQTGIGLPGGQVGNKEL